MLTEVFIGLAMSVFINYLVFKLIEGGSPFVEQSGESIGNFLMLIIIGAMMMLGGMGLREITLSMKVGLYASGIGAWIQSFFHYHPRISNSFKIIVSISALMVLTTISYKL